MTEHSFYFFSQLQKSICIHIYFLNYILFALCAHAVYPPGISLSVEQWQAFRNAVPDIVAAIEKLEGSD